MESRSVFVIRQKMEKRDRDLNYSTHGAFAGVEDAIGYGPLRDARKFLRCKDAQTYIDHELPEWARGLHCPVEIHASDLMFEQPELSALLRYAEENIPPHLLEPEKGRLLIWRR